MRKKLLFVPMDTQEIRWADEWEAIKAYKSTNFLPDLGPIDPSIADLKDAIKAERPDAIHIVGHGESDGLKILDKASGSPSCSARF